LRPRSDWIVVDGGGLLDIKTITFVDYSKLDDLVIRIHTGERSVTVSGFFAVQFVWQLKPDALEGKWLHWRKHAWAFHNLVAHPVMQILAWMHLYKAALWIHDNTVPEPRTSDTDN
jgi:hypothetical protein